MSTAACRFCTDWAHDGSGPAAVRGATVTPVVVADVPPQTCLEDLERAQPRRVLDGVALQQRVIEVVDVDDLGD